MDDNGTNEVFHGEKWINNDTMINIITHHDVGMQLEHASTHGTCFTHKLAINILNSTCHLCDRKI